MNIFARGVFCSPEIVMMKMVFLVSLNKLKQSINEPSEAYVSLMTVMLIYSLHIWHGGMFCFFDIFFSMRTLTNSLTLHLYFNKSFIQEPLSYPKAFI